MPQQDRTPAPPSAQFLDGAERLGLRVDLVPRPDASSLTEAAGLLGLTPRDIVKSMLVKHKDGFLFALVPGDRMISWKKLRALVRVNKLSLPDSQTALAATGYARGTITPIGALGNWPVYLDRRAAGRRIYLGAGQLGYSAAVDAEALASSLDATIGDFTDPA